MSQAPTPIDAPRKTRAPRVLSTFRLSNGVGSTISTAFRQEIAQALSDPQHPKYNSKGVSGLIRVALHTYYRRANTLKPPAFYCPSTVYQNNSSISTVFKSPEIRNRYEAAAYSYGITMSELILRCLVAYMRKNP